MPSPSVFIFEEDGHWNIVIEFCALKQSPGTPQESSRSTGEPKCPREHLERAAKSPGEPQHCPKSPRSPGKQKLSARRAHKSPGKIKKKAETILKIIQKLG
jgi:hypothetical protein